MYRWAQPMCFWPWFWILSIGSSILICGAILPLTWYLCMRSKRRQRAKRDLLLSGHSTRLITCTILRNDLRTLSASTLLVSYRHHLPRMRTGPLHSPVYRQEETSSTKEFATGRVEWFHPECSSWLCLLLLNSRLSLPGPVFSGWPSVDKLKERMRQEGMLLKLIRRYLPKGIPRHEVIT